MKLSCDQRPSQHWLAVPQNEGTLVLVNRLTSKCLDVPSDSSDNPSPARVELQLQPRAEVVPNIAGSETAPYGRR